MTWFHAEFINYPSTEGTPYTAGGASELRGAREAYDTRASMMYGLLCALPRRLTTNISGDGQASSGQPVKVVFLHPSRRIVPYPQGLRSHL